MYYLESTKTDPSWNLALEQYVFDVLGPRDDCFMLWQNDNTIVVGKHQNTLEEINTDYVKEHGVTVVRRPVRRRSGLSRFGKPQFYLCGGEPLRQ